MQSSALVQFDSVAGRELRWARPSFWNPEWQLRAGTDVAVRWFHPQWWRSRALAEASGASWTLERTGFFRRGVRATDAHGRIAAAYHRKGLRGGVVELANGQRLQLESEGFWRASWSLRTEQKLVIARFTPERGAGFRLSIRVEIVPGVVLPDLPLVLALVGYQLVMRARDHRSAAAVG